MQDRSYLNPSKNCEVIENSSKASLNCSPLKYTYLGKKIISISLALSQRKMKLKSGHLKLRFSVYVRDTVKSILGNFIVYNLVKIS